MKKLIIILVLFSIIALVTLDAHFQEKNRKIRSSPKAYCYSYIRGTLNPAFMVENSKSIEKLKLFYIQVENKNIDASLPSDAIILPQKTPVYILGYLQDSTIAEVYSYYRYGRIYSGNTRGYVSTHTLYDSPPSSEMHPESK